MTLLALWCWLGITTALVMANVALWRRCERSEALMRGWRDAWCKELERRRVMQREHEEQLRNIRAGWPYR